MATTTPDPAALEVERARIRDAHLKPTGERPASTARGLRSRAASGSASGSRRPTARTTSGVSAVSMSNSERAASASNPSIW